MGTHAQSIKAAAAGTGGGHLGPQSVAAAATAAPGAGGWIPGSALLARSVGAFVQTGAFTGTSGAFKIQVANDANGTGAADMAGGAIATLTTANTVAAAEFQSVLFDKAKFYGIACTVTGGTGSLVAGQLRLLDPVYAP